MTTNNLQFARFTFDVRGAAIVVEWQRLTGNEKTWRVIILPGSRSAVTSLKPSISNSIYFSRHINLHVK